ncbi:MAG: rhodanese-like domain-containing protein, partial [Candidatus Limnocylindria bacterium]
MTTGIREVSAAEAVALARDGYHVIDVREQSEWDSGHVDGATLVPLNDLPARIADVAADKAAPLLLHCAVGGRSGRAAAKLMEMGYTDVVSMKAPLGHWKEQGGPWEEPRQLLTPGQQRRYARQTLIPEIGQEGQRKLLDAKVLLIGAGALGSPSALYLSASGI